MAYRISRERFHFLAGQALASLPGEFLSRMSNITIEVDDYPESEDVLTTGVPREGLLGLFRGVEYPQKDGFFETGSSLPDEIVLFQKNIEDICATEKDLIEEIRLTLMHEIGHYFGLSEDDLRQYE